MVGESIYIYVFFVLLPSLRAHLVLASNRLNSTKKIRQFCRLFYRLFLLQKTKRGASAYFPNHSCLLSPLSSFKCESARVRVQRGIRALLHKPAGIDTDLTHKFRLASHFLFTLFFSLFLSFLLSVFIHLELKHFTLFLKNILCWWEQRGLSQLYSAYI